MTSIHAFPALVLIAAAALALPSAVHAATEVRHETIYDPNLQMTAYNVTIPSKWKFEGTYVSGTSCSQIAFPVFRAYSPDGLTELRRFPRLDWTWTNSAYKGDAHPDCLNLKQELSAKDFLIYLMGILQISYVRDSPIPQAAIDNQQKMMDQLNAGTAANARILNSQPMVHHGELAGAFGEYRNGSFSMEAQLMVKLLCLRAPINQLNQKNGFAETCNATVRMVRAPKGKLAGVLAEFDAQPMGAFENTEWITRYMKAQMDRNNAILDQSRKDAARAQAIRTQQHEQFMATMQEGTDRSMANARAVANSNHAIAQDWCDYSLNQQTVTGAGGTVKVSSAYTQTWSNGTGQYYQTNDPNANPNGVLGGNWSQTQKVHGDGSPY
jgi:hypothetical protein